jgi:hypothetical protein
MNQINGTHVKGKIMKKDDITKQLLSVCEDIARHMPGADDLKIEYMDFWTPGFDMTVEDQKVIKKDIRQRVTTYLKDVNETDIDHLVNSIKPATKKYLSHNRSLPKGFRYLFRRGGSSSRIPNDFIAPNIFQAVSKREGSFIPLVKVIKRKYGDTSIEMTGCLLSHYDALSLVTLLELKNKKKLIRAGKSIAFKTSLLELTKQVEDKNPWAENNQRAVWNSLKRLAGVVIEIKNKKGLRTIGHIIDGAEEIESLDESKGLNATAELIIYLDRYFLDLEERHFSLLDIDIMKKLKSKSRASCVYLFLSRQQSFYSGKWYIIEMIKLHDYSGLRPSGKSDSQIYFEITEALKQLEKENLLTWKKKGKLIAICKGQALDPPNWLNSKIKEETEEKTTKKSQKQVHNTKCPHGHIFGLHCDLYPECEDCKEWEACLDASTVDENINPLTGKSVDGKS